jgi:hypothetical protein
MKRIKLLISALLLVIAGTMQSQVVVTATLGNPPPWGPAEGVGVRYYYIPDIQAYYDVSSSMYIYNSNGRWIHSANLPHAHRDYDLYSGHKVLLKDYHGERPYDNYKDHQKNYPKGYNHGQEQKTFGQRPGNDHGHGGDDHGHDKK